MPQAVDSIALALEQLSEQVEALEQRVAALESCAGNSSERTRVRAPTERAAANWRGLAFVGTPADVGPVIGRAVLGIAGAYLLRALAELPSIPKVPVLLVAILYACFWMIWAVRTAAASRFASVTYAITSALILSPMLWESTIRFQVLSPGFASIVLVAFVVVAVALAWRHDLQLIPGVATLATVVTALALMVESRELVPLTAALLAVALATEIAACLGHRLRMRAIPALAADFAVWLLVYILASETIPEGYRATTPETLTVLSLALLTIYGGSIGVRSFIMRQRLTVFEIAQGSAACALATYGTLSATHKSAAPALGILFLLFAAASYWGTLARFTEESQSRNRRVSATWAAALLLGGSFLLLPATIQLPFLCAAAVAAAFLYTLTSKLSLGLHASFYLAAAAAVSPLATYVENSLAGTLNSSGDWRLVLVGLSALICYVIGSRHAEAQPKRRLLWIVPATLAGFTAAAFAVEAIAATGIGHDPSRLSMIRTVVNCALALALGFLGSRWHHIELGWVAYAAVAFGSLKLLFEDLRFGNAASLVVSLLFYGLVLILLPRLTRRSALQT
ncbi:MAG TPA: hypothetical protein VGS05_08100 [Candidatus Sulfotelmatobacter sp.]|nr:hypothetical protein [Candidatus Sulfotelmatobacter sp.]